MFPVSIICSTIIEALVSGSLIGGLTWILSFIICDLGLLSLIRTIFATIISMILGGCIGCRFSIYCSSRQILNCVTCDCVSCCDNSSDDDCPDGCPCSDDFHCCC